MTEPLFELHRFNGVERFAVATATCNAYVVDGVTEVVFCLDTAKALQTLADTEEIGALPHLEIGFRVELPIADVFVAGACYAGLPAFDADSDELMTNLYYCQHQEVDEVSVAIAACDADSVTATIEGTTCDVNYYDGSKPVTRIRVAAVFAIQPGLEKSFG